MLGKSSWAGQVVPVIRLILPCPAGPNDYIGRCAPLSPDKWRAGEQPFAHALRTVAFEEETPWFSRDAVLCRGGQVRLPFRVGPARPPPSGPSVRRSARSPRPSRSSVAVTLSRRAISSRTSALRTASSAASRCRSRNSSQLMLALRRIDLLLDEAPDELLDAAIDFAIDERAGTSKVTREASWRSRSARVSRSASCPASCSRSARTCAAQRVERLERSRDPWRARRRAPARRACEWP